MLKQVKYILNISLIKSYEVKNQNGIYEISENRTKTKFVDSSRIFKSIREINSFHKAIYFDILKVKLKPVHIVLLARGLTDCPSVQVNINGCVFSSETIYQFKNLLRMKNLDLKIDFCIEKECYLVAVLNILRSVSSWGKNKMIFLFWSKNLILDINSKFKEITLEKYKLTIYEENSNKIMTIFLKESIKKYNFKYFKSILFISQKKILLDVYLQYNFVE